MSQLNEAIARYHKILESEPYRDLSWVKVLQERMEAENLSSGGRLLCPFLRPNFVTQRQYDTLVKAGEALMSAMERMQKMALASPVLLSRMQLLPAEKMLAAIDPGYDVPEVSSKFDLQINNGSLHVVQYNGDSPTGVAYSEGLSDIFYDAPPVKEFRRKYNLTRVGGKKPFLAALLKANKQFGGPMKPNIAILEFRNLSGFSEYSLFRDFFRKEGYNAEIVNPEQLEYRNGILSAGKFEINLIYRRVSVQEFLVKFHLSHPLVSAYRDHAVCMVNSFRSELSHKRSMFSLLTDEVLTAKFPPVERKAIRDHVPWTRLVKAGPTVCKDGTTVDMLTFLNSNKDHLVLKPNDDGSDDPSFAGWEMNQAAWERSVRQAQRAPYVVQERIEAVKSLFPLLNYGHLEFKEMQVDVHPQVFLGKVAGCSSWVSAANSTAFSSSAGLTPTFIIDSK